MMIRGLGLQLRRCKSDDIPEFCADDTIYKNAKAAYNGIEANIEHLDTKAWSWIYRGGEFNFSKLGALPQPRGSGPAE